MSVNRVKPNPEKVTAIKNIGFQRQQQMQATYPMAMYYHKDLLIKSSQEELVVQSGSIKKHVYLTIETRPANFCRNGLRTFHTTIMELLFL